MNFPLVQAALDDFIRDLARAQRLLELMIEFREFGSSAPGAQNPSQSWPEAANLYSLAQPVRTDLPVFSGSILLYLAGRFEFFISESIEVATDRLVAAASNYNALPEATRKYLRSKTLEVAKDPKKYRLEDAEVTQLLEDLVQRDKPGESYFNVDSRLISMTDRNMRPDMVEDIFKRIGLEKVWEEIGKQVDIKLYFGTNADGQCKEAARRRLNDLMAERNEVAHPTGSTSFPSADEVLEYMRFLLILGKALSGQILLYLNLRAVS